MPSPGGQGLIPPSNVSSSLHLKDSNRVNVDGYLRAADLQIEDFGSVKEILKDLAMKMDILMDAISLAHMKGPDGKCKEDCWSCKVMENIEGIKVARKLRGPE
jgi:hypothetical protein